MRMPHPKTLFACAAMAAANMIALPASAAVIDFVGEAAGNERGIASGTSFASANFDGLTLRFDSDNPNYFPYFDDLDQGLPAGLGLCKALSGGPGTGCANPGDDNITAGEGVTVSFLDGAFDIRTLSFNNAVHMSLDDNDTDMLFIEINGAGGMNYTFAGAIAAAANGDFLGAEGIRFVALDTEFYVSSISDVPIPAALPLLLSGLAGLGFATRKRRQAA